MKKESVMFLAKLVDAISPSGFEGDAVRIWKDEIRNYVAQVKSDVHGNSWGVFNKDNRPRVMLAAHIDEIGYMVKYIDKQGYIYFVPVGGIDPHLVPGQRVWIKNKGKRILGVIGKKPVHCLEEMEKKKISRIEQMWIDIGAKDEKETRKIVDIGDVAVPAVGFDTLNSDKVIGRAFDDKAGVFAVAQTLKALVGKKVKAAVYGVATVQEEVGMRGARTSAYGVTPDVGIAIDVTFATDFPGMDKKKTGDVKLGGGPTITRGPNINPVVFDLLVKTAKRENIPYQIEAAPSATGTDANVIQLTKAGVATGLVSIPLRYMHTAVELISLKDLDNTIKLLCAFIERLDGKISFDQ